MDKLGKLENDSQEISCPQNLKILSEISEYEQLEDNLIYFNSTMNILKKDCEKLTINNNDHLRYKYKLNDFINSYNTNINYLLRLNRQIYRECEKVK